MILEKESYLTRDHREQINDLLSACRQNGDEGGPYPLGEENGCHYLLWTGDDARASGILSGVLGIFPLSDESAECIAFVLPKERRQGLFSQVMLPVASDDFADLEFVFPVRGGDEETIKVMNSIGAVYDRTEYMMELTLGPGDGSSGPEEGAPSGSFFKDGPSRDYQYPSGAASAESAVSHCRVERISPDSVCLTDVGTVPEMRGLGYGTAMIRSLKEELEMSGIRHVLLHVSGEDIPALSLYEKTGFRTTETLSYYIF